MRATYACGELSATSSSTSISLTTARAELGLVLRHEQHAGRVARRCPTTRSSPSTPAVSSRRRSTWACNAGHSPSSTSPLVVVLVVEIARAARPRARPGSRRTASCRRGTRRRTTGTTRSVRQPRRGVYARARSVRCRGVCPAKRRGSAELLRRDARLPEERRRLRQGRRVAARRRARRRRPTRPRPTSSSSTRARSSRPPARSRSTSRSRSPTPKRAGAQLVVTGCMAERYGDELAAALPEADAVVGFARRGRDRRRRAGAPRRKPVGVRDLLELPRPAPSAPWAYVKVAEGCDRACAFCAIPSFRGKQRSRTPESIEAEARALVDGGVAEIVLVAQDLAWYGRDIGEPGSLAPLLRRLDALRAARPRAHPPALPLSVGGARPARATMLELPTVVPYFDLSLQHAAPGLLRRMKRWGSGDRFPTMIDGIRAQRARRGVPLVVHRRVPRRDRIRPRRAARASSPTRASTGPGSSRSRGRTARRPRRWTAWSPTRSCASASRECAEVQDPITAAARAARSSGETVDVLVDGTDDDGALVGRTYREAPEIDGVVRLTVPATTSTSPGPGAIVPATVDAVSPAPISRRSRSRDVATAARGGIVTRRVADGDRRKRFGQGALATPANFVTLGAHPGRDPDAAAHPRRRLVVDDGRVVVR